MILFNKYKRVIQFLFALKSIISSTLTMDIHLIVVAISTLMVLTLFFVRKNNIIWKLIRICLLLELSFYDHAFAPLIVATLNMNIPYRVFILIFYTIRIGTIYYGSFQIEDWIFFVLQFSIVILQIYNLNHKKPPIIEKTKILQYTTPIETLHDSGNNVLELLNLMPFGVTLMDNQYAVTSSNQKARKYFSSESENNFQQQLFVVLQKACLQQNSNKGSFKKNEIIRDVFESIDDHSSDFQIKRLQSFSQPRRRWSQQKYQSNIPDIAAIINRHKMNRLAASFNAQQLKYKDTRNHKVYEFQIFEIPTGYMIITQNITNKEYKIDIQERYRFQSMLINSFSHELRTPLNCSMQLLQILEQQIKSELAEAYLRPAIISNQKLLHQINDILDFANFEAKTFKISPKPFELDLVTMKIKEYFTAECAQKKINLIVNTCPNVTINSDYERVMQILVNLMNNSVKFTRENGEIHFAVNRVGQYYQFEVYDTGCGIPIEKLYIIQKILQNFDQEHRGEEEYIQYVGLGLKVSSQIAKKLFDSGELKITSSQHQFTRTSFVIKDFRDDQDTQNVVPSENSIQEPYRYPVKLKCSCAQILICDDIPFNHLALQTVLKFYNVKSDSVYDGVQAIDTVKQKFDHCQCGYKMIFMDIEMPGIDGFQASREIFNFLNARRLNFVIIMCSAFDSKENLEFAAKNGMREVLPKPVQISALKRLLNKYYF